MAEENLADDYTSQLRKLFIRHREFLVEHIDPDFGILDKLIASEAVTERDNREIRILHTFDQRNSKLLELIMEGNVYDSFLSALKKSNQNHIVNYLTSDGVRKAEFEDDWPLIDDQIRTLRTNHESLVDLMEPVELVVQLYSSGVLNLRQRNFVDSKPTTHEKNEAILEILKRCSIKSYRLIISCLFKQNQHSIANIMEFGGAIARISVDVEGAIDIKETEAKIVENIKHLLADHSSLDRHRIYELVEMSLAAVKIGSSIILYFLYQHLKDLNQMQDYLENGHLRTIVENIFNQVIEAPVCLIVKIKTEANDLRRYLECFNSNGASFTLEASGTSKHDPITRIRLKLTKSSGGGDGDDDNFDSGFESKQSSEEIL